MIIILSSNPQLCNESLPRFGVQKCGADTVGVKTNDPFPFVATRRRGCLCRGWIGLPCGWAAGELPRQGPGAAVPAEAPRRGLRSPAGSQGRAGPGSRPRDAAAAFKWEVAQPPAHPGPPPPARSVNPTSNPEPRGGRRSGAGCGGGARLRRLRRD